jgi:hypothetical protein
MALSRGSWRALCAVIALGVACGERASPSGAPTPPPPEARAPFGETLLVSGDVRLRARGAVVTVGVADGEASLTSSVSAAGETLLAAAGVDREGDALVRVGRHVVERFTKHPDGIEQTWTFAERPTGSDDVSVRIEIGARAHAFTDRSGVHFVGPRLRFGHGAWIDARGRRTEVPAAYRDGAVVLRLPRALLEDAAYPAVLDPTIGSETFLDTPLATRGGKDAAAAFGAGVHLLVSNGRADRFPATGTDALDKPGVVVGPESPYYTASFDGTRFLVAYDTPGGLRARTVEPDGTPGATVATLTTYSVSGYGTPAMFAAGTAGLHLVVWPQSATGLTELWGARVKSDGTVLDPGGTKLAAGPGYHSGRTVTATAAGFLVGWTGNGGSQNVVGVSASGALGATSTIVAPSTGAMTLAYSSGVAKALAVWSDFSTSPSTVSWARVDASGAFLDPPKKATFAFGGDLQVAAEDAGWLLTFNVATFGKDLYGVHVGATGALVEAAPFKIATLSGTSAAMTAISSDPSAHLLACTGDAGLVAYRIATPTSAVTGPFPAFYEANHQTKPVAAANAAGDTLVAWSDDRAGVPGVYALRVSAAGVPLDTAPRRVSTSTQGPSVAYGKGKWFVAITAASGVGIEIVPMRDDGTLEPTVTTGTTLISPVHAQIAHDGTRPIVVRLQQLLGALSFDRLDDTGKSTSTSSSITLGSTPVVAAAGDGHVLVAYQVTTGLQGIVFDPSLGTAGAPTSLVTGVSGTLSVASAAVGLSRYYVGYTTTAGVAGAYLLPMEYDGTVGKPVLVSAGANMGGIAPDASGLGLSWALPPGPIVGPGAIPPDSMVLRFGGTGPSLHPAVKVVAAPGGLVAVGTRKALFAHALDGRAAVRTVAFASDIGTACSTDVECETGVCVDGYCCDGACGGQCEACDVAGRHGLCTGIDGAPHGARSSCVGTAPSTVCGIQCLGGADRTKCTYPTVTAKCGQDACAGAIETHASTCDGAGACADVPKSCGAYACVGTTCKGTCTTRDDCIAGYTCVGGACVALGGLGGACATKLDCGGGLFCADGVCCGTDGCPAGKSCAGASAKGVCTTKNGEACTTGVECGSSFCADGVCCQSACLGQCAACDVKGSEGSCVAVSGAPHGKRAPCDASASDTCKSATCDGSDSTRCAGFVGLETVCKPATCTGGSRTKASTCDGTGACSAGPTSACDGFGCDGTECRTTCASDAECAVGYHCSAGACLPDTAACDGDAVSVKLGVRTTCAPYLCDPVTGDCRKRCSSESECASGLACDSTGSCIVAPATDSGGGCDVSAARDANGGASMGLSSLLSLFSLCAIAALGAARRRHGSPR